MNLQFYFEKLHHSEEFKKFIKENPKAYFCSGFVVIDKEKNENKIHLDYFVPGKKKFFSFELEKETALKDLEKFEEKNPEKISENIDFDFKEIENIIEKEMQKQKVKNKVQKIMLSLHKLGNKDSIIGTIFISMLGMIKIKISLPNKKVEEFEKKNLFDMVKISKKK